MCKRLKIIPVCPKITGGQNFLSSCYLVRCGRRYCLCVHLVWWIWSLHRSPSTLWFLDWCAVITHAVFIWTVSAVLTYNATPARQMEIYCCSTMLQYMPDKFCHYACRSRRPRDCLRWRSKDYVLLAKSSTLSALRLGAFESSRVP